MILIIKKRLKMRRNQLYIPLFIATLAIVGSSCNDFLDELPDNRTELNSEQKIAKMLVSAYPEGSPLSLSIVLLVPLSIQSEPPVLISPGADIPVPHKALPTSNMDKFVPEADE